MADTESKDVVAAAEPAPGTISPDSTSQDNKLVSLDVYRDAVRTLARERSPFVFHNKDADHAAVVIETILDFSRSRVDLFDESLSGDISGRSQGCLDAVRKFVERDGSRLRVLVEKRHPGEESNIEKTLEHLALEYPGKVCVRLATETFKEAVAVARKELKLDEKIYFTVGDNEAVRLELPLGARTAFCTFHAPRRATLLHGVFDHEFKKCPEYFEHEDKPLN